MRLVVLVGFRGLVVALAVLAFVLIAMRLASPWPEWGAQGADATVAVSILRDWSQDGSGVYLLVDGADPEPDVIEKLRIELPHLRVRPFSERTAANDHCGPLPNGLISVGPCKKGDFLKIEYLATPLWRTALFRGSAAACGYELVVVKGLSRWHVASRRWLCT